MIHSKILRRIPFISFQFAYDHQFTIKLSCLFFVSFFIRVKLVRLGHPARLLPQVLESALDAQVTITFILRRKNF